MKQGAVHVAALAGIYRAFGGGPIKETLVDGSSPVAVVVVGRNYGRYLRDCLASVLQQDPLPKEIVYIDNASTDNSIQIAREMGVRVGVVSPLPRNICSCRNRGALITTQPYLIFLDADDLMSKGYVKGLLDCIEQNGRLGFVFPRIRTFGLYPMTKPSRAQHGYYSMLRHNSADGASIIRRVALNAVGGWGQFPCFQDWELWLRMAEQGWLFREAPDAWIDKRSHAASKTANSAQIAEGREHWYQEVLRQRPITAFIPFGPGRPICGERFFEMLDHLGLIWDKTTLLFYDGTSNLQTANRLRGYLADCPARNTVYIRDDTKSSYWDLESRVTVMPERMSEIWSRADKHFTGAFVMSIEDDNIPEHPGAVAKLYEGLGPDVGAVCGPYHSRPVVDSNRLLALEWFHRKDGATSLRQITRHPGDLPDEPTGGCTDIGATGVGFTLIRREILHGFEYPFGRPGQWMGQDFGLWRHLRDRGDRLVCHWGAPIRHYYTPTEYT